MASVVSKALRGGSYLFLQRVCTFALNSFVLRKLQLSITGAVTVRLELALASIFFLRDGFRLAFLRMPSLDMDDHVTSGSHEAASATTTTITGARGDRGAATAITKGYVQQLVNVAWLSTAISWLVAIAIILSGTAASTGESTNDSKDDDGLQDYALVLAMYCVAAMVEALAEPMYVLAHCSVLVSWQVTAQGAGFLVRALVQYACIFVFDLGLLAYGFAEIAYAATLFLVFAAFFWRRICGQAAQNDAGQPKRFALTSMLDLLPRAPPRITEGSDGDNNKLSKTSKSWFHPQLLSLLVPLSLQSGVKYLLTEGDKWVLSLFASFQNMGVYGIVFHLGSLVPRIVFLPIEEATKTIFSKMAATATERAAPSSPENKKKDTEKRDAQDGFHLVLMLLKLMNLIGLVFICFGATYSHTLVLLLYGVEKARLGVSESLAIYCFYIHFLGLNGICEAFVHAVGTPTQLMRLNKLMGGFFVLYATSAALFMSVLELGTPGIILANCVNMGCRILYCLSFMAKYFLPSGGNAKAPSLVAFWRQSLPDRVVLIAFLSSFGITASSRFLLLSGAAHSESLVRHAAHVAIGGICFSVVALALYVRERHLIREQLAVLRRGKQQPSEQLKQHDDDAKAQGNTRREPRERGAGSSASAARGAQAGKSPLLIEKSIQNGDARTSADLFLDGWDLARRVHELVFEDLALSYKRLKRQQDERDAAGILPKRASQTLLENRLVVEAKRKVDLLQIAENRPWTLLPPGLDASRLLRPLLRRQLQRQRSSVTRPTSRREPQRDRVRYIMSTRLGALPPTKNTLDEYPIPKEILDALEKHRHYHVDESSLMPSFDPIKAESGSGSGGSGSAGSAGDWGCYVRRSVPVEREPISFVLASLEVASERPVPLPSDIFHQHVLESATNDDLMLTEVRQLYDRTHESYREFRSTLHRHLAPGHASAVAAAAATVAMTALANSSHKA